MNRGVLGLALLVVSILSLLGAGKAQASCIYNVGSTETGSTAMAFNFSSNAIGIGGYSSSALAPGTNQCWYGVGWSGGRIGITGSVNDLVLQEYFGEIEVEPHGWVEAWVMNSPEEARWGACAAYVNAKGAHLSAFDANGNETLNAFNQVPVGTDCYELNIDFERLAGGSSGAGISQFVLASGTPQSPKTKSVTIHVYGASGGKALGSVCIQGSTQTVLSMAAKGNRTITLGATEKRHGCKDPGVMKPELHGTPRPDRSYSTGCYGLRSGDLRIVRYPQDFSAAKPARCRAQNS